MANVPVQRTWTAGEVATGAYLNTNVRDAINFLLSPPLAILRQSVQQAAIASGSYVAILFDTEDIDRDGGHSTTTNTSRYTAQTPGYYDVDWLLMLGGGGTGGYIEGYLQTNGNAIGGSALTVPYSTITNGPGQGSHKVYLNSGDYLELAVFNNAGASLAPNISTVRRQPRMAVQWCSQ